MTIHIILEVAEIIAIALLALMNHWHYQAARTAARREIQKEEAEIRMRIMGFILSKCTQCNHAQCELKKTFGEVSDKADPR